jgi:hypothetical protein
MENRLNDSHDLACLKPWTGGRSDGPSQRGLVRFGESWRRPRRSWQAILAIEIENEVPKHLVTL